MGAALSGAGDAVGGGAAGAAIPAADSAMAVPIDELYARFDDGGNRYGPRFRCVRELYSDGAQTWGRLALDPQSVAEAGRYIFHPALLDASLQMVLELLRIDGREQLYVPIGVDRIEVSRAVGSEVRCLVRNAHRSDGLLRADIYIYDNDGTPITVLEGSRCRAIEAASIGKAGAQALRWGWEPAPAEGAAPPACAWRLFGFSHGDADQLGSLSARSGCGCSPMAPRSRGRWCAGSAPPPATAWIRPVRR